MAEAHANFFEFLDQKQTHIRSHLEQYLSDDSGRKTKPSLSSHTTTKD